MHLRYHRARAGGRRALAIGMAEEHGLGMTEKPKKKARRKAAVRRKKAEPKLSRHQAPEDMDIAAWQAALRRQYGRAQRFELRNVGAEPIFSEYRVRNPESGRAYRVAIRGTGLGENFCSCPDFKTNQLGTCKHVEFTLGSLERRRGGKTALRRGFTPRYSEVWLQYGARRTVRFRPAARCPAAVLRQARRCFDSAHGDLLPDVRSEALDAFLQAVKRTRHDVRVYDDALAHLNEVGATQRRHDVLKQHYPRGASSAAMRRLLQVPLYPYQAEGALFAARAGRALIADEMGLGKTIQAIAAAEILMRHAGVQRVLVVCPTSLRQQWTDEITRFTRRNAAIVAGTPAQRSQQFAGTAEYLITSYDSLIRDRQTAQAWRPDIVIADEAQRIKNWETRAARALKDLESPYAFVLTGTPMENRLEELVSIVELVDRYRLGPLWRFLHNHQVHDDGGRVVGYRQLDQIRGTLSPIMLRRRQADVLQQLPPRTDKRLYVTLTREQREIHEERSEVVARIVARWRRQRFLSEGDQRQLTAALQQMRMVCNSTYLLDASTDHGTKVRLAMQNLSELLETPETKVVIFSQWLATQELLIKAIEKHGWGYVRFHGSVPGQARGALVRRFREEPACRVFLASDAGGVGLNLQHASAVINMDLPWNPAVLAQRIGRVHRLGQHRPVRVLEIVAENSIESGMLKLLGFKQSLFAGALDGGKADVFLEGTRLAQFMEGIEQATGKSQRTGAHLANGAAPADGSGSAAPADGSGSVAPAEGSGSVAPADGSGSAALPDESGASSARTVAARNARSGPDAAGDSRSAGTSPAADRAPPADKASAGDPPAATQRATSADATDPRAASTQHDEPEAAYVQESMHAARQRKATPQTMPHLKTAPRKALESAPPKALETAQQKDVLETVPLRADSANPLAPLLEVGQTLVTQLAAAADSAPDPETGQRYLQIPVPEPEVLQQLTDILSKLLKAHKR